MWPVLLKSKWWNLSALRLLFEGSTTVLQRHFECRSILRQQECYAKKPEDRRVTIMEPKHAFDAIDKPTFDEVLQRYSSSLFTTSPDEGDKLDKSRYITIPDAVKARKGEPYLEKHELVELVTWKLYVWLHLSSAPLSL